MFILCPVLHSVFYLCNALSGLFMVCHALGSFLFAFFSNSEILVVFCGSLDVQLNGFSMFCNLSWASLRKVGDNETPKLGGLKVESRWTHNSFCFPGPSLCYWLLYMCLYTTWQHISLILLNEEDKTRHPVDVFGCRILFSVPSSSTLSSSWAPFVEGHRAAYLPRSQGHQPGLLGERALLNLMHKLGQLGMCSAAVVDLGNRQKKHVTGDPNLLAALYSETYWLLK